ncbi:zinc finger, CCHC-type containing protein [Tanacetum coccineum]
MGDENPICNLRDYSKPSHEGYRNTIKLPEGNNVVPLRSDTIRLVQNGCLFYGLWSEDPNQHLKDFLTLVDSLDLDGYITTWEDLTTRFLAQFVPSGRTAKLRNDILMFQQHQGESLSEAWARFKEIFYLELGLAITDQIPGTLPSDTVKNPKLGTHPVSSARSYLTIEPQCSSHSYTLINAIKAHFKEATISQTSLQQSEIENKPSQPEEPEPTLEDEFQDLQLNLPVLEVLAYTPI